MLLPLEAKVYPPRRGGGALRDVWVGNKGFGDGRKEEPRITRLSRIADKTEDGASCRANHRTEELVAFKMQATRLPPQKDARRGALSEPRWQAERPPYDWELFEPTFIELDQVKI